MAVDWLKIKNEYVNGLGSYRVLAEKHGVSVDTIKKRAAAEKWKAARTEYIPKLHQKVQEKTFDKISDALSDETAAKVRIKASILRMIQQWIDNQEDAGITDTGAFRRIVQCCSDLGVFEKTTQDDINDDGFLEALNACASVIFGDGDDSALIDDI